MVMVFKAPNGNRERQLAEIAAKPARPIDVPRADIEDWIDRATDAGWLNPELESRAIMDVFLERHRQQHQSAGEGFSLEHDDAYTEAELIKAAMSYAANAQIQVQLTERGKSADDIAAMSSAAGIPPFWPWHSSWWKPRDARRNLVRAAALLIAEIERLDRAAAQAQQEEKQA